MNQFWIQTIVRESYSYSLLHCGERQWSRNDGNDISGEDCQNSEQQQCKNNSGLKLFFLDFYMAPSEQDIEEGKGIEMSYFDCIHLYRTAPLCASHSDI